MKGTLVTCEFDKKEEPHTVHRGHGYIWRPFEEYQEPVEPSPVTNPVVEAQKLHKQQEEVSQTATEKQVGGDHYKSPSGLQPIDVIDAWGLDFYEGTALKYIARHRKKNGREDIEKAIHYLELLLERQY